MTTTSPRASAPGSKAKAKAKTKTKANSGSKAKTNPGSKAKAKTKTSSGSWTRASCPPWEKDWRDSINGFHLNAVSMKPYRGVNRWMTLLTHMAMGYQDPRWLTYRQAEALGGHVRRGEKSTEIVFWKRVPVRERDDEGGNGQPEGSPMGEDGKPRTHPMLRSHRVFNVDQTEDCRIDPPPSPPSANSTPGNSTPNTSSPDISHHSTAIPIDNANTSKRSRIPPTNGTAPL